MYAGVPYSSHNDTLASISSLIANSSSNTVKDPIIKKNVLRATRSIIW